MHPSKNQLGRRTRWRHPECRGDERAEKETGAERRESSSAQAAPAPSFSRFVSFCLHHIKHRVLVPMFSVTDVSVPNLSVASAGPGERCSRVCSAFPRGPRSGGGLPGCRRALAGGVFLHSDALPGPFGFTSPRLASPEPPTLCHAGSGRDRSPPPMAMQPGALCPQERS